jgi:hypothetical protein
MSTPGTIAAYAAVGSAVVGVYSAYEAGKEADRAYERQMAQFRDSFRAATTNAEWARADAAKEYTIKETYNQEMFDVGVDAAWEAFFVEDDKNKTLKDLEIGLNNITNSAYIDKMVADAAADLTRINDQAQLDAEYALAMAQYSNDYTAIKAATDAATKAATTQQAVMFLDQDINTIKEQLNMAKEALRAGKADAIGKEILATAASLGVGASTSRRIMSTNNKADFLMQQKIKESDNAIDRAIAMQKREAREMGISQTNIYNTAIAQINKTNAEAFETSEKIINTAKLSSSAILSKLDAAKEYANDINTATNSYLSDKFTTNSDAAKETITNEIDKAQKTLDAEKTKNKSALELSNMQSIRAELVSFSEEYEGTKMSDERLLQLNTFYQNNAAAIEELRNDPTFNWIQNEEKMQESVAKVLEKQEA